MDLSQVGAAMASLCGPVSDVHSRSRDSDVGRRAQCTSLKANMGHLEACAAAAGLASLVVTPLLAGLVSANAQLRWFVCSFVGEASLLRRLIYVPRHGRSFPRAG